MADPDYSALVASQREYFLSGSTRLARWRKAQLEAVKALFTENHDELCAALWKDLRRNVTDADLMDVEYNVKEADYALTHLDAWMEPQRVHTPLGIRGVHQRARRHVSQREDRSRRALPAVLEAHARAQGRG